MSLPRYLKYKDSGVAWLGEIPEHWEIHRIKELAEVINGYPFDSAHFSPDGAYPLIRIRDLDCNETATRYGGEFVPAAAVTTADVLIGMDGDFDVGRWFGDETALLNQRMCCMRVDSTALSTIFLHGLPIPLKAINDVTYSTTVKHLSSLDVGKIRIALPADPAELTAIAVFLERETGKIDALVAEQEKLLTLLAEKRQATISRAVTRGLNPHVPMKDSGVAWLGKVPAHWEVSRVKHHCSIRGRIGFRGYTTEDQVDEGEGALVLGATHITSEGDITTENQVYLSWEKFYESPEIVVESGDVLVVQRGSTCGKVGLVEKDCGATTINPSLVLLKRITCAAKLLSFYLSSTFVQGQFGQMLGNTAIPMLSQEQIGNIVLCLPPESEQAAIVAFLRLETAKIDALKAEAERAIGLLKELRSAVISAAVTGKIDVRNVVPQELAA